MEKPDAKSKNKLILVATAIIVLMALAWSAELIGKGIWQLLQKPSVQTAGTGKNIPNFALVPNVPTGVFNYGGSTAWAPLRLAVDSVIQSERPELQLRYVQPENNLPGSSQGIKMLLEGKLAFAQSSRPLLAKEYDLARHKGLKLKQVPVAVDGIAVAVNPSLNISGLTLSQLQRIYTGEISNWQELGGPNLDIIAYSRPLSTDGTVAVFAADVLQDREFGANVEFISTTTQALRQLANNPGGIYYGSAPAIIPQCSVKPLALGNQEDNLVTPYQLPLVPSSQCPERRNQLNTKELRTANYPLTHYLYVVFLQNEDNERQIGQAYADFLLTPQGQKLIAKTGFIPLN